MRCDDPEQARVKAEVLGCLLDATWGDVSDLERMARDIGLDLGGPWTVVVLTSAEAHASATVLGVAAGRFSTSFPHALVGKSRALPADHLPTLVPSAGGEPPTDAVELLDGIAAEFGLLAMVPGVTSPWNTVSVVYRGQVEGIPSVRALRRRPGVVRDRDWAPFRLLQGLPVSERVQYVRTVLGPLLAHRRSDELLVAIEAYLAAGRRIGEVASELNTHRNTLRYTLARAQEILGLDLRKGSDRMRLELALALRRLDAAAEALLDDGSLSGER